MNIKKHTPFIVLIAFFSLTAKDHPLLENKTALITGGTSGIGLAIAQRFAQEGAHVIIAARNGENGKFAAKQIPGCTFYQHDVSDEKSWKVLFACIGHLDILINNAGITNVTPDGAAQNPEEITLTDWNIVHATNLNGVMLGCKYGIKNMKPSGGVIINIASRTGLVGFPHDVPYASSKAAIINHTKSVALYCAQKKYNIRCNAISPAVINTPMWEKMMGNNPEKLTAIAQSVPLGHFGSPDDVASLVLYLASDESKFMTGANLVLDGGVLAG